MAERPNYQVMFQFKRVQLLKDQSLGIGSYGAVCKAKCDDLLCAAKIIHPTLFDLTTLHQIAPQREHRLPIRRFEQECEFMSAIRHPNIVQYLGMFRDTDTHLPVLLMELMDDSLTHFLESSTQPIPYHIQVNICDDITLALSFLHSNNIIHRDLSSNNILLHGNIRAKVTDFGMARLGDINPQAVHFTNTMCPGTDVYMPPEAVQEKPLYTEKIDCFSFGVIIVQILTRQFPKPGDRLQEVEVNHPIKGLPRGRVCVRVLEIDRRQNHITLVPPNHSLLPIALNCLNDEGSQRPSAYQLCERVADLKGMPKYRGSLQETDEIIQSQVIRIEEKDRMISSKEEENQQLRQQLQEKHQAYRQLEERERQLGQVNQQLRQLQVEKDQVLREKSRQINEKERQLGHVNKQLEASEKMIAQFARRIAELEQQLDKKKTKACCKGKELTSLTLRWREGKRAPCETYRYFDTIVDDNRVHVRDQGTVKVYSYDITSDNWSQLPDCVHESGSLTIINGWITTVGGGSPFRHTYSNELFSLTGESSNRKWTKKFPPMPTKRRSTTALCTGSILIVAGGRGADDGVLSTVEVMSTENLQWSTAADLPKPMLHASSMVCGDQIYMLGGTDKDCLYIKSVYTCSVSALLQSCDILLEGRLKGTSLVDKTSLWQQLSDLPLIRSTCESFHGKLLAFGGYDKESRNSSTAVYTYNSTTNSWDVISHMTIGRCACFTAVLPDNQLMVLGGLTGRDVINTVEIASVYDA